MRYERFKLLVINTKNDLLAHAVTQTSTTWAPLCGAGVDLRLDEIGRDWHPADQARLIECPECRRLFEQDLG